MLKTFSFLCVLSILITIQSVNASENRQMGTHLHGEGNLDIAVENQKIQMNFKAPAMDIVGFEYKAKTQSEKEAISKALKKLSDPLALFGFPDEARCKTVSHQVELIHSAYEHEEDGRDVHEHEEKNASDFNAEYTLECKNIRAFNSLSFPYFDNYENAERVNVQIISDHGAYQIVSTRQSPKIILK